jgi:prevent-host-death family protein
MMKIELKRANLASCVDEAQRKRIVLTRHGKPVALVVGVEGMDEEQVQLGGTEKFWKFIAARRRQKALSRAQLEQKLKSKDGIELREGQIARVATSPGFSNFTTVTYCSRKWLGLLREIAPKSRFSRFL